MITRTKTTGAYRVLRVPAPITRAGEHAAARFREFFLQRRSGPGRRCVRAAQYRAVQSFFRCLERRGITELDAIDAAEISAYLDDLLATASAVMTAVEARVTVS